MQNAREPEFITPHTIKEMNDDQLDELIEGIADRRLAATRAHAEAVKAKRDAYFAKVNTKLDKQCEMLSKELERMDKLTEKIEQRMSNMRALRLEIGDIT